MATDVKQNQRVTIPDKARDQVCDHLQNNLTNLVDLSLQLKQAHWNLIGKHFRSFHLMLDEIIETTRGASDEVAERIATLALPADGRSSTVAKQTDLEDYPSELLQVETAVSLVADRLETTIVKLREAIEPLGDLDPISEDMLIAICGALEKHLWMVQTQEL